jgi:hypothetical protein
MLNTSSALVQSLQRHRGNRSVQRSIIKSAKRGKAGSTAPDDRQEPALNQSGPQARELLSLELTNSPSEKIQRMCSECEDELMRGPA